MGALFFLIIPVGLVVLVVVSIRLKRHGEVDRPDPSWHLTDEVFNDPTTNRLMRVWVDRNGIRHYVAERMHPGA